MINITKSWFFEETKKKDQQTPSQAHQEENQDPKIKVSIERREITTHTIEIHSKSYQNTINC